MCVSVCLFYEDVNFIFYLSYTVVKVYILNLLYGFALARRMVTLIVLQYEDLNC